jgi:hypothetical protein
VKRDHALMLLIGAGVAALVAWVAMHTYWDYISVPTPMKGDAARNPYYSVEHLAGALDIHAREIATLRALQPDAVVIVNDLRDDLLHQPLESLQTWVESGGRLMIGGDTLASNHAMQIWSGVKPVQLDATREETVKRRLRASFDQEDDCAPMKVRLSGEPSTQSLRVCMPPLASTFASDRVPVWSLSDGQGVHVLRIGVGLGELIVFGPRSILSNKSLPVADHAAILIAALGLRRGDTLLILSPSRAEPLIALLWRIAAPAILFLAAAMLLLIARHLPRFGPPVPAQAPIRRSLAEQIRANARFAWRTQKLRALRRAVRRSLDEAAQRRIAGFAALDTQRRADALAASTGIDSAAIAAALTEDAASNVNEHRAAITLLEICRRILVKSSSTTRRHPA